MPLDLLVYNPSPYGRKGFVTTAWQPIHEQTHIPPEQVAVYDSAGVQLDAQVHRIDPADPTLDVLVFKLDKEIAPGPEDYSQDSATVTVGPRRHDMAPAELRCAVETRDGSPGRVTLTNSRLQVQLELSAAPWGAAHNWYAGSATTVLLDGREILDAFHEQIAIGHDMEKRCMQVDRLRLSTPAWLPEPELQIDLFNCRYELLSRSDGPLRTSVCIASPPFEYRYFDPFHRAQRNLVTRLYRVISLYRDADFVVEELFVHGAYDDDSARTKPVSLYFRARYFTYMDLGLDIDVAKFCRISDWFVMASVWAPFQGYGFAADAHVGPVLNPHPEYPVEIKGYKSFSWELECAKKATCIHLFSRGGVKELEARAGLTWYEHIYKPLGASTSSRSSAVMAPQGVWL